MQKTSYTSLSAQVSVAASSPTARWLPVPPVRPANLGTSLFARIPMPSAAESAAMDVSKATLPALTSAGWEENAAKLDPTSAKKLIEFANGDINKIDARLTFEAAELGDPVAEQVVLQVIENVGRGIASVLAVLDPDGVVVGGGVVHSLENRWNEVIDAVRTYGLPRYETRGVPVSVTQLGDDVSLLGASVLAFSRFG